MISIASWAATVLLLATAPGHPVAWPPDVAWVESAAEREITEGRAAATDYLAWQEQIELQRLFRADLVALGSVASIVDEVTPDGYRFLSITINVEQCLKGECSPGVITTRLSTMVGGETPPEEGARYVFLLRTVPSRGGVVVGGGPRDRFMIEDGLVKSKGVPEAEFLDAIGRELETRRPGALFDEADAVVLGTVTGVDYTRKSPEDDEGGENSVSLVLDAVAKGDLVAGSALRIVLPYTAWPVTDANRFDVPRFATGERVVVFVRHGQGETWTLAGGCSSKMPVRADGSFGAYSSIEDLLKDVGRD